MVEKTLHAIVTHSARARDIQKPPGLRANLSTVTAKAETPVFYTLFLTLLG